MVDDDRNENHDIRIYPDPASDNAMDDSGKKYHLVIFEVHNLSESIIKGESYINSQYCEVDLGKIIEGIFFVSVTVDKGRRTITGLIKYL